MQASGSNALLVIAKETVYGTPPAAGWEQVAMATYGETIQSTTEELQSNAIKKGRGISTIRSGMKRAEGSLPIEFGSGGLNILLDGLAGNSTGAGTVLDPYLWKRKAILPSFSIEKQFTDINQYFMQKGYFVNTLELNLEPGQFASGNFSFVGRGDPTNTQISAVTAYTTVQHEAYTGIDAEVLIDDVLSTSVASLTINITNELEPQDVIGSNYAKSITVGRGSASGSISLLFEDTTVFLKWLNETRDDLKIRMTYNDEVVEFHFPQIKYNGAGVPGITTPNGILYELNYSAEVSVADETDFIIKKYTTV